MVLPPTQEGTDLADRRQSQTRSPKVGRNAPCPCGRGRKYKNCCLERDQANRRKDLASSLPPWILDSTRKLNSFERYTCKVYDLPQLLRFYSDGRRNPNIPTFDVVNSLFHAALLRLPSINALEGNLQEADFQQLIGHKPKQGVKTFSADVVANVLDQLDLEKARQNVEQVIWKAERNKAFREGSYGTLRCVAIDGWEPFCSYDRHCPHCLTRWVKWKNPKTGEVEQRKQYYHRYVVALLLGSTLDVVLGLEAVRINEAQKDNEADPGYEGELTAGLRLMDRLHESYGSFIDAFVCDALYANGPTMTKLDQLNYGGFIVLKKDHNEPLQEALALWEGQPPTDCVVDVERKERIEFWDAGELQTLESYEGKVRVVRAVVTRDNGKQNTWCFGMIGKTARKLGLRTAFKIMRARWHIENTAFNQWVQYWNLSHVYRHSDNALQAILNIWILVFNLLQLFVYRRLRRERQPKDPIDTIRHLVEVMCRDLGAIPAPLPWPALVDSS